jgi:signal transduction histidine kinase
MFLTLRSRLWLTYALVIGLVLCVVGTALAVYLARNPQLYRQEMARLKVADLSIARRETSLAQAPLSRLQELVRIEDEIFDVRAILLQSNGKPLVDSRLESASPLLPLPLPLKPSSDSAPRAAVVRDADGGYWLYVLRRINDRMYLMLAVPRPRVRLLAILRDDLFVVLARGGLVALLLSFFLGLGMARWISTPLQRMSGAVQSIGAQLRDGRANQAAAGDDGFLKIPLEGPQEVQVLADQFNKMAYQVHLGQRSQREFVANVSHELKTPLTSIQGFAQAILDGAVSSPEALRQSANIIHDEAGRMYRMVLDLLVLTRLEGGTADLKRTPLQPDSLLRGVVERLSPQAAQAQVTLDVQMPALPDLVGDEDRLAQVFTNLLDNAIKFTAPGGRVTLTARPQDGQLQVAVADTGPGMPLAVQERLFERFYQVDASRRGKAGRGTGLGLAIAREIVRAHHGTIQVASYEGRGSCFTVCLPLRQPEDAAMTGKWTARKGDPSGSP